VFNYSLLYLLLHSHTVSVMYGMICGKWIQTGLVEQSHSPRRSWRAATLSFHIWEGSMSRCR
jgi:hypothetical protein